MISFLQLVEDYEFPEADSLIVALKVLDAFEHPDLYNWDSLPTVPEKAVMDALDGEVVYTSCSQKDLLDAALSQPELVMIVGNVVRRFL